VVKMGKKERGRAGETLTETLVTILIIGLTSVLFLTMVGASGRIFRKTEQKYGELYEKIADADVRRTPLSASEIGTISVDGENVPVQWYGDREYVLSYEVG